MQKIFLFLSLLLLPICLLSQTPEEILRRSEDNIKGRTSMTGNFTMNIANPQNIYTLNLKCIWEGNENSLITITTPENEFNNQTLKKGSKIVNYLSSKDTTIDIESVFLIEFWHKSDFTYDDILLNTNLADNYNITLLPDEVYEGENCWKLELNPKSLTNILYGRIFYYIKKSDKMPIYIQYYSLQGVHVRSMYFTDVKKINGYKIPTKWTIKSEINPGYYTEFIINNVEYNAKISDDVFTIMKSK